MLTGAALAEAVAGFFAGRKVVVVTPCLSYCPPLLAALDRFGAAPPFVVAGSAGPDRAGALAEAPIAGLHLVPMGGGSHTAVARATEGLLANPPAALRAALDRYDPQATALVLAETNVSRSHLGGRRIVDSIPEDWWGLLTGEDQSAPWASLGVSGAPSGMVPTTPEDLAAAHERYDFGHGTVWHADHRSTVHVATDEARLVQDGASFGRAVRWAQTGGPQVRVTTFVEGLPLALNGIVLPTGTVALRPGEELLYRQGDRLRFAGCSLYYSPGPADLERLRQLVVGIGDQLADRAGFRGAFSVSGTLRAAGFLPYSLSLRPGPAHALLSRHLPGVPIRLLQAALMAGHDVAVTAADLERDLRGPLDADPGAAIMLHSRAAPREEKKVLWLTRESQRIRPTRGSDRSAACLIYSRNGDLGGFVSLLAGPGFLAADTPAAPHVAAAMALADEHWEAGIGPLTPVARRF
ncbi:hypothetical protein [Micromonospora sp. DT233]|uniref:hypothetical protein n=1 Tax=Micromonospora sp. DT233 TaxID=3393432 RepID=UPI003CED103F